MLRAKCLMYVAFHICLQWKQRLKDRFLNHILIVNKLEMKWQSAGWQSPIMPQKKLAQCRAVWQWYSSLMRDLCLNIPCYLIPP
jgi:hypothetical protein